MKNIPTILFLVSIERCIPWRFQRIGTFYPGSPSARWSDNAAVSAFRRR